MKTLAVFDFDCTLTRKDSFINFLLDTFGFASFCKGIAVNVFPLLLSSLRLTFDDELKERVFQHFFSGWSEEAFNSVCTKYSLAKIDGIINQEALEKVNWHRSQHHTLVIASASINTWIMPWAKRNDFSDVIATEPEIKGGTLTGGFRTKNCKGPEKLRRFLERYPHRNQYFLYAYGDSQGDKPLLNIADKPFFRSFH